MKDRINRTVFELWTGELIFGLLAQAAVFFFPDKLRYSACLWIGVISAMAASYHMWWALDRSLEQGESEAPKQIRLQYVLRYLAMCIVLGAVGIFFGSYVLAAFAGLIGIKISAYMQPLTKKISRLVYGEEILPPVIEYLYDDEEIKEPAKEQE
ncbi:MAG: hypothetical protein K5888_10360 [Lachnospiraceae bacterium]|nr:hypothetical protein [Lachnospiraceae bacterium]